MRILRMRKRKNKRRPEQLSIQPTFLFCTAFPHSNSCSLYCFDHSQDCDGRNSKVQRPTFKLKHKHYILFSQNKVEFWRKRCRQSCSHLLLKHIVLLLVRTDVVCSHSDDKIYKNTMSVVIVVKHAPDSEYRKLPAIVSPAARSSTQNV